MTAHVARVQGRPRWTGGWRYGLTVKGSEPQSDKGELVPTVTLSQREGKPCKGREVQSKAENKGRANRTCALQPGVLVTWGGLVCAWDSGTPALTDPSPPHGPAGPTDRPAHWHPFRR